MFTISDFDHQTHISMMTSRTAEQQQSNNKDSQDDMMQAKSNEEFAVPDTTTSSAASSTSRRVIKRTTQLKSNYARPGRPKQAAFLELLYGSSLYAFCIFLPHLPRYIYQTYIWTNFWVNVIRERILWSTFILWRITLIVLERI